MWCIPTITPLFIERMEEVLSLYAKPYNPKEPVICVDEKSKQLIADIHIPTTARAGRPRHRDYEYRRNGTRNIFLAVEPKGGWRKAKVTARRTKKDFAEEIDSIVELPRYRNVRRIHFVLDNLNTHFEKSFIDTFGTQKAKTLMRRIKFHYTPIHASWLNMAEIELSIMSRQALAGRIPTEAALFHRLKRWQQKRNAHRALIRWKFTKQDARNVFKYDKGGKLS